MTERLVEWWPWISLVVSGGLALWFWWRGRPATDDVVGSRKHGIRRGSPALSLKADAARLLARDAQWPEILRTLNPGQDPRTASHLQAIRGPHLFNPATALRVIQHGCEVAEQRRKHASVLDALQAARDSMDKVIRYGE